MTSGERASAAHLQIARFIGLACDQPVDDLVTDLFTINNAQPGSGTGVASVCMSNAGSASLAISVATIDLVDTETACTGDEAAAGDASCGPGATLGELSSVLFADIIQVDCAHGDPVPGIGIAGSLSNLSAGASIAGLALLPGEVRCLQLSVQYPAGTPDTAVQIAQTDKVTWRFAFDGTTS